MINEATLRDDMKKYISPIVFCPSLSVLMIGTHEMSLRKAAALKAILAQNHIYLSRFELKKPFIIAYWNTFGRGF